jgi:ferredoxin--NADP+ reductase/benzoate/toluate 1,2-dioxygenase reductase subunit
MRKANKLHQIKDIRYLTDSTFLLRLERNQIQFRAGQYITTGLKDSIQHREYSIYSGEKDAYLEILIREILDGDISPQLKTLRTGQHVEVNGPFGYMKLDQEKIPTHRHVFIASGTGIAPFHSFVSTYPEIDYTLLHGVRYATEAYDRGDYDPDRYVLCTSRDKSGNYQGYVTSYLEQMVPEQDTIYYVCGNSNMIYDAFNLLERQGVARENILSEVYF